MEPPLLVGYIKHSGYAPDVRSVELFNLDINQWDTSKVWVEEMFKGALGLIK